MAIYRPHPRGHLHFHRKVPYFASTYYCGQTVCNKFSSPRGWDEEHSLLSIQVKDILQSGADIIVFSAHPSLLAGSGVSGIVHKAAGPELEVFATHGGKSTGPKAEQGKSNSAKANLKHGKYTKQAQTEHSEASAQLSQLEDAMHLLGMSDAPRFTLTPLL